MPQPSPSWRQPQSPIRLGLEVLAVLLFISLKQLFLNNMGATNEVDVLPLARQQVDPGWIPGDWYLNQPAGYRFLFATLAGQSIVHWGFLATSIGGRLLCYALAALGLVGMARQLGLGGRSLLVALGLFLYLDYIQGVAAHEWLLGALEAKSVAYGFVLLGLSALLGGRYRGMAVLLGLATSFHVLVGGWMFVIVLGWLGWHGRTLQWGIRSWLELGGLYALGSAFAIPAVLAQLFTATPTAAIAPSFIYVFLRLPHHLNPQAWPAADWIKPLLYLGVLVTSMVILNRQRQNQYAKDPDRTAAGLAPSVEPYPAQVTLFQLTLISGIPYLLGVAIAPFDNQGQFLQFYPFRVGDVLLPLTTCLLGLCALQQWLQLRWPKRLALITLGLIVGVIVVQSVTVSQQVRELRQFPSLEPEVAALYEWIRTETPPEATIVTPPVDLVNFTWLTQRATIAKYKLLPQNKPAILAWHERLADLAGGSFPQPQPIRQRDQRREIERRLTDGYDRLKTKPVKALMAKYGATYFLAHRPQRLKLPIAYRNQRYILYRQPS